MGRLGLQKSHGFIWILIWILNLLELAGLKSYCQLICQHPIVIYCHFCSGMDGLPGVEAGRCGCASADKSLCEKCQEVSTVNSRKLAKKGDRNIYCSSSHASAGSCLQNHLPRPTIIIDELINCCGRRYLRQFLAGLGAKMQICSAFTCS